MSAWTGKRILVTRARAQAGEWVEKLAALGAVPVLFPTIEIGQAADPAELRRAIAQLETYAWVIFTSVNGVQAFWAEFSSQGKGLAAFRRVRVAAIGPATAQALAEKGVTASFVPPEYVAESILPGLGDVTGRRILLPRAEIARKALAVELERRGARVDEIAVYRTLPPQPAPAALAELESGIDIATFTSSSTVNNFFEMLADRALPLLNGATIACIGPITAETARARGLDVAVVAQEYTCDGLVAALGQYLQNQTSSV